MYSFCRAIVMGRVKDEPRINDNYASFRVETVEAITDRDGNNRQFTNWIGVSVNGKDRCQKVLDTIAEGMQVLVEGPIGTRKIQMKDGTDRYITEIRAITWREIKDIEPEEYQQRQKPAPKPSPKPQNSRRNDDDDDGELPF